MMGKTSVGILSLCLLAATGCRQTETGSSPPPPEGASAPGGERAGQPIHEHMQAHFDAIVAIRDSVIDGNLQSAKDKARWVIENEAEPPIATWREHIGEIRQWAADIEKASGIEEAAAAAAELARACGHCHSRHSVTLHLPASDAPPDMPGRLPHMRRHQWAAERMWEGLIGPAEERWTAGAAELAETPLIPEELRADQPVAPRSPLSQRGCTRSERRRASFRLPPGIRDPRRTAAS